MPKSKRNSIFKTKKRIKLGIWGLGRGMSFYKVCNALNFDVVAGCDYNEHMRDRFLDTNPGAFATDDADAFLNSDIDAVLLATYCPAHAEDAIRCLEAGKHVVSEVTSFHTMAEGVRLVEAVEKSGLVYNLAENYPFTKPNLYLAAKWREGLFGELMYGEYEYVHECRSLQFTYIDGVPVQPGWTVHNWRSWQHYHYYNTHSLGPMMHITGTRPIRVAALPGHQRLAGYLQNTPRVDQGGIAPSLITMDNGAIVRNLMGSTTNDSHARRLWGTKGSSELVNGLHLRLGGSGGSPKLEVTPEWPDLGEYADTMGHGGGDFWIMYYFARQILYGKPAYFDVYNASDCTIPGILAFKSVLENGRPFDVPDFRKKEDRDACRNDNFAQARYDIEKGVFPEDADKKVTGQFSTVVADLINRALVCRAVTDWLSVADEVKEPAKIVEIADRFIREHSDIKKTFRAARKLANAYPGSDGAMVLVEMLDLADADKAVRKSFLERVKKERTRLKRRASAKNRK